MLACVFSFLVEKRSKTPLPPLGGRLELFDLIMVGFFLARDFCFYCVEETHLWRHLMAAICGTIGVRGLEIFGGAEGDALFCRFWETFGQDESTFLTGLVSCLHDGTPNIHRVCCGYYKTRKLRIKLRYVI